MEEARANILRLGGIPAMNTFSKLYLALLVQFPWKYCPPSRSRWCSCQSGRHSTSNKMSLGAAPCSCPCHHQSLQTTRELPPGFETVCHELYPIGTEHKTFVCRGDERLLSWRNFFLIMDDVFKAFSIAVFSSDAAARIGRGGTWWSSDR